MGRDVVALTKRFSAGKRAATAALLQVAQGGDLAGQFQIATVDRIAPAFDVDAADEVMPPQQVDDPAPVGVAETRMPMPGKGLTAVFVEVVDYEQQALALYLA
jgi:hypothetical protein